MQVTLICGFLPCHGKCLLAMHWLQGYPTKKFIKLSDTPFSFRAFNRGILNKQPNMHFFISSLLYLANSLRILYLRYKILFVKLSKSELLLAFKESQLAFFSASNGISVVTPKTKGIDIIMLRKSEATIRPRNSGFHYNSTGRISEALRPVTNTDIRRK